MNLRAENFIVECEQQQQQQQKTTAMGLDL